MTFFHSFINSFTYTRRYMTCCCLILCYKRKSLVTILPMNDFLSRHWHPFKQTSVITCCTVLHTQIKFKPNFYSMSKLNLSGYRSAYVTFARYWVQRHFYSTFSLSLYACHACTCQLFSKLSCLRPNCIFIIHREEPETTISYCVRETTDLCVCK